MPGWPAEATAGIRPGQRHSTFKDLLAVGLLVLLAPLFFWRLFAPEDPDRRYVARGDFTEQFFPEALLAARILRQGELPLWNPLSFGGRPLAADPQQALFYPLQWPLLLAIGWNESSAFQLTEAATVAHVALAAAFMYLLHRYLAGGRVGALVSAVTYAFSGYMLSYPVQQVPILRSSTWLPLVFLLMVSSLKSRSWRRAITAGGGLAMALLAGHPQTVLYQALALACLTAYWAWTERQSSPKGTFSWLYPFALYGLAIVSFCSFSAVQVVPSFEFGLLSERARPGYDFTAPGYSFRELLPGMLVPRIFENYALYIGVLPPLLAALALLVRGERMILFFAGLAAGGLLLSTGGNTFLNSVLYLSIPGFSLFQHQERGIVLYVFSMATLAGYGAGTLTERLGRHQRQLYRTFLGTSRRILAAMALLVAVAYLAGLVVEAMGINPRKWERSILESASFLLVFSGAAGAVLHLRARSLLIAKIAGAIVLGLVVLDLFSTMWTHNLGKESPSDLYPESSIVSALPVGDPGLRVKDAIGLRGNHGMVYGLPTVDSGHPLSVGWAVDVLEGIGADRGLLLFGVTHVVTSGEGPPGSRLVLSQQIRDRSYKIWEVATSLGPALLVPEIQVVEDDRAVRAILASPGFDPRRTVLLSEAPPTAGGASGTAEIVRRTANTIQLRVRADGSSILVVTETFYPGWQAWVDGEPQPVLRADLALRAVPVGPGEHTVLLRYDPISFKVGLAITVSALTVGLLLALTSAAIKPPRPITAPTSPP